MKKVIIAATLAFACTGASAQTLFFDDFNDEMPALNTAPSGWTVVDGTVDIIGSGPFGSFHEQFSADSGFGYYIDLDGSTSNAGILSNELFFSAATLYELTFNLAGSQRPDVSNTVSYGIDWASLLSVDIISTVVVPSAQAFTQVSLIFSTPTAQTGRISFENAGGDNIGALIDDVRVAVVPEPEVYAMMLVGFGLLGFVARRRSRVLASA